MSHDTAVGVKKVKRLAREKGLPCLPGIEVSTIYNHILAFGIQEWPYRRDSLDPEEAIDFLRDQDCALFLSHPYSKIGYHPNNWTPNIVKNLDIDGIEWTNATIFMFNLYNHYKFKNFPIGRRIAGSDAHSPHVFGSSYTQVAVNSDDPDDVVSAMKKGKCMPHTMYPHIYQAVLMGLGLYIENEIVKKKRVDNLISKPVGDRPGSIVPDKIPEGSLWRQKFLKKHIKKNT